VYLGLGLRLGGLSLSNTYDSDALTYLAAVEAADGAALEMPVKVAINNFVVGCKADGIWSAIKASCILAGARTLSGALVPLVGTAPTNNGFVSGDYNRKTGLLGDGASKFIDTNRSNSADGINSKHFSVYLSVSNDHTATRYFGGTRNATGNTFLGNTASANLFRLGANLNVTSSSAIFGLFGASRPSDILVNYISNSSVASIASTATSLISDDIDIFRRGTDGNYYNNTISFYSIGTDINLALLDTRITTLMNTLNAIL
jgi:hypothetical protein